MEEDKDKLKDDYVEFIEIDGDDSNSTIVVEKRCKKHIKSHYDPKTTVPLPCPYKPPGGKITYCVNPRLFQVVDSKGNRIQPVSKPKRSSKLALSSTKKSNLKITKQSDIKKGGLKFGTAKSDSKPPAKRCIDLSFCDEAPTKKQKTLTQNIKALVPYQPPRAPLKNPDQAIKEVGTFKNIASINSNNQELKKAAYASMPSSATGKHEDKKGKKKNPSNSTSIPLSDLSQAKPTSKPTLRIPYGAIVSIVGTDIDPSKYPDRATSQLFFGTVQNPYQQHNEDTNKMTADQSLVTFVLSGKYEWYDKNRDHVRCGIYENRALTICAPPPTDDVKLRSEQKRGFLKWFSKTPGRWKIKTQTNPCHGCGDPWCLFKNNTDTMKKIIREAKHIPNHVPNNQKRHHCYREAARSLPRFQEGKHVRRFLGWCYENQVRKSFPDDGYTGYKNVLNNQTHEGESSSDESVIYHH